MPPAATLLLLNLLGTPPLPDGIACQPSRQHACAGGEHPLARVEDVYSRFSIVGEERDPRGRRRIWVLRQTDDLERSVLFEYIADRGRVLERKCHARLPPDGLPVAELSAAPARLGIRAVTNGSKEIVFRDPCVPSPRCAPFGRELVYRIERGRLHRVGPEQILGHGPKKSAGELPDLGCFGIATPEEIQLADGPITVAEVDGTVWRYLLKSDEKFPRLAENDTLQTGQLLLLEPNTQLQLWVRGRPDRIASHARRRLVRIGRGQKSLTAQPSQNERERR